MMETEESAMFLDEAPSLGPQKWTRIIWSVLYCVLLAGYFTLASAATWIFHPNKLIPSWLCSSNVALLIVTGIFQHYLVYQVKTVHMQGYYSCSQKLELIVRIPLAITMYGTAAMLLVIVWKLQISILSISALLRIIMLTEAVCAACFMSAYIGYVHQHNSSNPQPDILKSLYHPLQSSNSLEGLRCHDGGRLSDQQMALWQYQRENLQFLNEEIMRLQGCSRKYEQSDDGSISQVDLSHHLAARDDELRIRSAEISNLRSMLRLARSEIAERDFEFKRIRTTNKEYVAEHDRLREMLEQWSDYAKKLERALMDEKTKNQELQQKISDNSKTGTSS